MAKEPARPNTHETAETWLHAAAEELKTDFASHGLSYSGRIVHQVAFSSNGKPPRGRVGRRWEYWPELATADGRGLIILLRYTSNPVEILTDQMAAHLAAALGLISKPDKAYREHAARMGLEGSPTGGYRASVLLAKRLNEIAASVGSLPWGALDWSTRPVNKPPKQTTRLLKATCTVCEKYSFRISRECALIGATCPVHGATMNIEGLEPVEAPAPALPSVEETRALAAAE